MPYFPSTELSRFAGATHEQARKEYATLDREIIKLRGAECASKAASLSTPPAGRRSATVGEKSEMELINHMVSHPAHGLRSVGCSRKPVRQYRPSCLVS